MNCPQFQNFEKFTSGGSQNVKNAKNLHKMVLELEFSFLKLMDAPENKKYIYEWPHFRNFGNFTYGGIQIGKNAKNQQKKSLELDFMIL